MRHLYRSIILVAALVGAALPVRAQLLEAPPPGLWRLEANGDAVQTSLDLVLPQRWQGFERTGFTWTNPDGGSAMVHYRRSDGPLKLRILVQLRSDVRGAAPPGANGLERNWSSIQSAAQSEYSDRDGAPVEVAGGMIVWGDARVPNTRTQLRRYRLAGGNEIQGIWYRNIGVWGVMISVSGPEGRRSDIEAAGRSAMKDIAWPGAPISAELKASEPEFLRGLRDCGETDRSGSGELVEPGTGLSSAIALALQAYFIEGTNLVPHPAVSPEAYCRIETFNVGRFEVLALGWKGDVSGYPAARYAFMLTGTGIVFQFESFFTIESLPPAERGGIRRLVWMTSSGSGKVALLRVLTHWPSYEQAKAIVISVGRDGPRNIVELTHPPGRIHAIVNYRQETIPAAPRPPGK